MTIDIGFYGAGLISQTHRLLLADSGLDHRITAVHDPDADRARAFAAETGADVVAEEELLDRVAAVYVTTWTSEHPRLVELAAARGVAVFCEKPLAVDGTTAAAMVECVEQHGIVNQVGLILRSMPVFVAARELVRDPRAGRLLAVVFRDDQYLPNQGRYASTWRTDPSRSGRGALLEHSIHDLDILRWMFGPVVAVNAVVREVHGYRRIDDVAVARLEFEGGGVASLTSVWHDVLERPSMRHVEVLCERLHLTIVDDTRGPLRYQFTGEPARSLEGERLVRACEGAPGTAAQRLSTFGPISVFNTAASFLRAVAGDAAADPSFVEALPAHRLVDAVYASADAGGVTVEHPEAPLPC